MKLRTILMTAALGVSLAACSNSVATRNTPLEKAPSDPHAVPSLNTRVALASNRTVENGAPLVSVHSVNVRVPRTLKVSEANLYFPKGDIVWREDPLGDRHAQVHKIVSDAMTRGVKDLDGPVEVILDVEVVKFHALTEKARYTVGGIHNLEFKIAVIDAESGKVLTQPQLWKSDLNAYGGQEALEAVAAGQTQKVRITDHLAKAIREELTLVEGHENAKLGLLQAIHSL
ncbi:MAG: DUF6778 family protein [Arenibacterium sp.]